MNRFWTDQHRRCQLRIFSVHTHFIFDTLLHPFGTCAHRFDKHLAYTSDAAVGQRVHIIRGYDTVVYLDQSFDYLDEVLDTEFRLFAVKRSTQTQFTIYLIPTNTPEQKPGLGKEHRFDEFFRAFYRYILVRADFIVNIHYRFDFIPGQVPGQCSFYIFGVFIRIHIFEQSPYLIVRFVSKHSQKLCNQDLWPFIRQPHRKHPVPIHFYFKPLSSVRDDSSRIQYLGRQPIMHIVQNTFRSYDLVSNHSPYTVDDEKTLLRHHRHIRYKYFLLLDLPSLGILQLGCHIQWTVIRQPLVCARHHIFFQITEAQIFEIYRPHLLHRILHGRYFLKKGGETLLQKLSIRFSLRIQEIRIRPRHIGHSKINSSRGVDLRGFGFIPFDSHFPIFIKLN